ncbi:hypothetical protein ACJX0J_005587, partial [Zea mays]
SSTKHLAPKVNATAVSIADSLLTAGPPAIIARLFARPLTKVQMEEIMELANHGKGKKINNKKGRKVAPFLAPVAPLALEG